MDFELLMFRFLCFPPSMFIPPEQRRSRVYESFLCLVLFTLLFCTPSFALGTSPALPTDQKQSEQKVSGNPDTIDTIIYRQEEAGQIAKPRKIPCSITSDSNTLMTWAVGPSARSAIIFSWIKNGPCRAGR